MSGGWTPSLVTKVDGVSPEASVLASEHGLYKRVGITIDADTVAAGADGNKVVKAGTVLAEVTATGKYAPYDSAGDTGTENASGIITESVNARDGDVITHLLLHGSVLEARLVGLDETAKAALSGRIIFQ